MVFGRGKGFLWIVEARGTRIENGTCSTLLAYILRAPGFYKI